jgi:hypothetical protein
VKRTLEIDEDYLYVNAPVVQWECADPRLYGNEHSVTIPLPTAGVGLPYPFTYPKPYVTVPGESGARVFTNAGSVETPWTGVLVGPVVLPVLTFTFPDGSVSSITIDLALGSGETLELDVWEGTALLNGATDRYGALSGAILDELYLPTGATTISWTASSGSGTFTVTARDAEM